MPQQNSPNVVLDFSDAPGGDLNLDDVFGDASGTQTTVESQPNDPAAEPVVSSPAPTNDPVIKTKTGTVYKTLRDAEEGIEHKDALISQLRQQLQQTTGQDPLTPSRPANAPINYMEQQDKYFEDIAHAVETKNTKAYMEAQRKLVYDSLGPIAPTLIALSKANAAQTVEAELPQFKGFLNSEEFRQTLQESPLLADAIAQSESNPASANQLRELYRIAYLSSQGRRLPQLIQSAEAQRVAPPVPRPTVHSTPVPPPAQQTQAALPNMQTPEGRRALIQQMEGRGVGDLKF